jgi:hypothetical protein
MRIVAIAIIALIGLCGCSGPSPPPENTYHTPPPLPPQSAPAQFNPPPTPPRPPELTYGQKSLRLKQSMSEAQVKEFVGQPSKADLSTCGGQTGKSWQCKSWTFGNYSNGLTVYFHQTDEGEWRVNHWRAH